MDKNWKLIYAVPLKLGRWHAFWNFVIKRKTITFQAWVYSENEVKLTIDDLQVRLDG
jgi:hypothetical protein